MATRTRSVVPEFLRQSLSQKAGLLIQNKFNPTLPIQAEAAQKHGFNYLVELYTRWRGKYFYFCAKYRTSKENGVQRDFEELTTRMEYTGGQQFRLAFMRHTGQWCEVYPSLTLEECLETIEQEEIILARALRTQAGRLTRIWLQSQ